MTHALNEYLCSQFVEQLGKRRVVVFYDPRHEFGGFLDEVQDDDVGADGLRRVHLGVEGNAEVQLARFTGSYFGLRATVEPLVGRDEPELLVVYVPGEARDRRGSVLMELEKGGAVWGDSSSHSLRSVARRVLRARFTDGAIDQLLKPEELTYGDVVRFLEQAAGGSGQASMLRTILGRGSSEAMLARWLAQPSHDDPIAAKGARDELYELIEARIGLALEEVELGAARDRVLRYVLAGEFRDDLACAAPSSLGMIPEPATKEQLGRAREIASTLRSAHDGEYAALADQVEQALGLASAGLASESLGAIDTFRFEERALLLHAGELIVQGAFRDALDIISERSRSFWVDRDVQRQAQWEACRLISDLGDTVATVRPQVAALAGRGGALAESWIESYAASDGWYRADLCQRRLEAWIARMDDEPETEKALGVVRRLHEDLLEQMAQGFSAALVAGGWVVPGVLHQTGIYPEVVETVGGRVAYFFVDAMRYEMGVELVQQLQQLEDVTIRPAVSALPSITPMGMAALLPGASSSYSVVKHRDKLASRVSDNVLPAVGERMRYLRAVLPAAKDITLGELLQKRTSVVKRKIGEAPLLVVRSQEIDALGETDGGMLARQVMDTVVANLARAVRKLADLGFDAFVLTADHGHQFAVQKGDDMKMEKPGGKTVDQHRRFWAGYGGETPSACVRVSGAELGYDTDLEFLFPKGLAIFRAGGSTAFHHGGISLQEVVVPVVTLRAKPAETVAPGGLKARLGDVPSAITNRTFGVKVSISADLFLTEPVALRVVLLSAGEEVGVVGMAYDAELDRGTGVLRVTPGTDASVGLMLTRDDCKSVRLVIVDPETDAILDQSGDLPVKLGI